MIDKSLPEGLPHIRPQNAVPQPSKGTLETEIRGEAADQRPERGLSQGDGTYCLLVGQTPVKISYDPDGAALEQKIKSYFWGLKH